MLHVAISGIQNGDLERVLIAARMHEPLEDWVVPKGAKPGDQVLLFLWHYGFVARAVVAQRPMPGTFNKRPAYRAGIKDVRLIDPLIPPKHVMREIPSWAWPSKPLIAVTLDPKIADELERVIEEYEKRRSRR